jgi:hypothetical protein
MPSFGIVGQVDRQAVKNSVGQTNRETQNRRDINGADTRVEQSKFQLVVCANDEFKPRQVMDVLRARLWGGDGCWGYAAITVTGNSGAVPAHGPAANGTRRHLVDPLTNIRDIGCGELLTLS